MDGIGNSKMFLIGALDHYSNLKFRYHEGYGVTCK